MLVVRDAQLEFLASVVLDDLAVESLNCLLRALLVLHLDPPEPA